MAHLVWQNAPLLTAFSSTADGGLTWTPARAIRLHPDEIALNHVQVLPNSDLLITYQSFSTPGFIAGGLQGGELGLFAIRSEDGGESWSDPATIGQHIEGIHASVVAPDGSVYVVWETPEVEGRPGLVISRSSDGGATWLPARHIEAAHFSAFLPAVTVAPNGTVGVVFDDLRNDQEGDEGKTAEVRLLQSTDGGATWEELTLASSFSVEDGDWVTFAEGTPFESHNPYLGDHQSVVATKCGLTAIFALGRPYAVDGSADMFVGTAAVPSEINGEGCRHRRADSDEPSAQPRGGF
ncbi:MAG: glycoside hydrolase [Actinomycetota bacterium]|nr:glycoside hydrolase [Actinomycetota bacterium]